MSDILEPVAYDTGPECAARLDAADSLAGFRVRLGEWDRFLKVRLIRFSGGGGIPGQSVSLVPMRSRMASTMGRVCRSPD